MTPFEHCWVHSMSKAQKSVWRWNCWGLRSIPSNIWRLSCTHRNSRNILHGSVHIYIIYWVCLKHQNKRIPRPSKAIRKFWALCTRTMPRVCENMWNSSPPGASGLCAANAPQQRPWPSAWPAAAWLESLHCSPSEKGRIPRNSMDAKKQSLLPYRSVHRCGGPTWPLTFRWLHY